MLLKVVGVTLSEGFLVDTYATMQIHVMPQTSG